jgi:hypothetical protein
MWCVVSGARCRARAWVEQGERLCVHAGMRTPVSAARGVAERGQSEARAWPMRGLGGRGQLGELGGGEWDLVVQWWTVASPRSLIAMGGRSGLASEEERGQGGVSARSHCEVGSGWCWSGAASH